MWTKQMRDLHNFYKCYELICIEKWNRRARQMVYRIRLSAVRRHTFQSDVPDSCCVICVGWAGDARDAVDWGRGCQPQHVAPWCMVTHWSSKTSWRASTTVARANRHYQEMQQHTLKINSLPISHYELMKFVRTQTIYSDKPTRLRIILLIDD